MTPTLSHIHMLAIAAWLGILGVEGVLEFLPLRRPELRTATSTFHYYVDLFVELPVLFAIILTGVLLLKDRTLDTRLTIKVAAGGFAVAVNLLCVGIVALRHRGAPDQIDQRTRMIYGIVTAGTPAFLIALFLGLGYAGWLG